jgi:hypothetical protein
MLLCVSVLTALQLGIRERKICTIYRYNVPFLGITELHLLQRDEITRKSAARRRRELFKILVTLPDGELASLIYG